MNGLEPQAYITDVIGKIAADWPAARWDELLPLTWQSSADQSSISRLNRGLQATLTGRYAAAALVPSEAWAGYA